MMLLRGVARECSLGLLEHEENDNNISLRRQKQISKRPSHYANVFDIDEDEDMPMRVINEDNYLILKKKVRSPAIQITK